MLHPPASPWLPAALLLGCSPLLFFPWLLQGPAHILLCTFLTTPPPPRLSPLYSALVAPENTSTNFGTLAKRAVGCWYLMSLSSPRKVSSLQEHPWHPLHVCLARDAPRSLEESSFFLQRRACSLFRTLGFDFTEVSRSFLATGGCPLLMDFASKEDSRKEVWPQAPRELAARGHLRSVVESTELHFLRLREVAFLV